MAKKSTNWTPLWVAGGLLGAGWLLARCARAQMVWQTEISEAHIISTGGRGVRGGCAPCEAAARAQMLMG